MIKTPAEIWSEGYKEGLGLEPPRSAGNPYRPDGVPESAQLYADAQALADVRTLDGAATTEQHWVTVPDERSGWRSQRMVWKGPNPGLVFGAWLSAEEFYGATPDEARAKAVAWVREHT